MRIYTCPRCDSYHLANIAHLDSMKLASLSLILSVFVATAGSRAAPATSSSAPANASGPTATDTKRGIMYHGLTENAEDKFLHILYGQETSGGGR